MARIRTIKPEFFRHELLQELEKKYPEARPMLVFAALWGHCDKAGSFLWKTRLLALDVLPYLGIDIAETLRILVEARLVVQYSVRAVEYGNIPSFRTHQRINGREGLEPSRFPPPPKKKRGHSEYVRRASTGHNADTTGTQPGRQEGKGREGKGIKRTRAHASLPRLAVDNVREKSALQKNGTAQPHAATAQAASGATVEKEKATA